ncbi:M10 family metallopeptidase [Methylobacterium tarhaniae]|uniref:M10 family metallopeptidase n=1 Tax=Methylobacterium tarhaniae TaxID=1187852 RepID=UPI003D01D155
MVGIGVVEPTGRQDIDGILWGWKWDTTHLTYSFPASASEYGSYAEIKDFTAFNTAQQDAVRRLLANVADIANLTFTETTASGADLRFANASAINYSDDPAILSETGLHPPGNGSAEANPPELGYHGAPPASAPFAQGDSWYGPGYTNPALGSFAYSAGLMHETGHNLGLKHGHMEQDAHGIEFPVLPYDHNSYEYSVMTYVQYPGAQLDSGDNAPNHPTTFMQDDIAALQYLYGANYSYNSGDTVYTWNAATGETSVDGVAQGRPDNNFILMTLWDGGGNDTYDLSNYTTDLAVDLNPGQWSTFAPSQLANLGNSGERDSDYIARGNVANAGLFGANPASLIENATGGTGNDALAGNDAGNRLAGGAGADTLSGLAGNDILLGQDGDDRVVGGGGDDFGSGGWGRDTVAGGAGNDLLFGDDDDDWVDGGLGDDRVYGGTGIDTLFGSEGADIVAGQQDDDFIGAGAGNDFALGGDGNDEVHGEDGNDLLFGDEGNDGVYGEAGDDLVHGGGGNDFMTGDAGNDRLLGESGDDRLSGGDGADDLSGGAGNDTLAGDAGSDLLFGNAGDDLLSGGAGPDVFAFGRGDGRDRILDFVADGPEADVIAFKGGAFTSFAAVQAASRQDGADLVIAFGADDAVTLQSTRLEALTTANFAFA